MITRFSENTSEFKSKLWTEKSDWRCKSVLQFSLCLESFCTCFISINKVQNLGPYNQKRSVNEITLGVHSRLGM